MKPISLSKSRFKLALECPRKLVYVSDSRFASDLAENDFLNSLADGGHQVGALAKLLYPQGIEITSKGDREIADTMAAVSMHSVVLFEPAFRHRDLLVRVDILAKRGDAIQLIEVKSKSIKPTEGFRGSKGKIGAEWRPYVQDIAFQYHVLSQVMASWKITPYLLLIDSSVPCTVDSLSSRIRVRRDGHNAVVTLDPTLNAVDIPLSLLTKRDVSVEVQETLQGDLELDGRGIPFHEFVEDVAGKLAKGEDFVPHPSGECKRCEFYCGPSQRTVTHLSGWAECMARYTHEPVDVPRSETVFGLYGEKNTYQWIRRGALRLRDLTLDPDEKVDSVSPTHRHALQVDEARGRLSGPVIRHEPLRKAIESWSFPLHFIDFETCRPTLPFHKGRRPNQQLLFQFSHHVLSADGRLSHQSQCLIAAPGLVPNAPVLRELRTALGSDQGTIIHWWSHEKTVLGELRKEIADSVEIDRTELVDFIDSLLKPSGGRDARLVDLGLPLVSRLAYFPGTEGRSSIKKVLPAVLRQSAYLQGRYSRPIYGTPAMPSLNFNAPWAWIQYDNGSVRDPYELLDPLFQDKDLNTMVEALEASEDSSSSFIANGGAAMMAYGQLQRWDLSTQDRKCYEEQLKRYCELDSLGMVMVFEALQDWVKAARGASAPLGDQRCL